MFVLIAAPVYRREWILPLWFEAIEKQDFPLEDLGFMFLMGPRDLGTLHELLSFQQKHPELRCFDIMMDDEEDHREHQDGHRHWPRERYFTMAKFRNQLLDKAACYNPDRYFTLDTDIILEDPNTISQLVTLTEVVPAVSPLTFMTPQDFGGVEENMNFPNIMNWFEYPGGRAYRQTYHLGGLLEVDITMAVVMMSRDVYTNVRYEYHPQGEDLGWSANCAQAGYKLHCASYIFAPHIMSTRALEEYLESGDPRGERAKRAGEDRPV